MAQVRVAFLGCGGYQRTHVRRMVAHGDASIVALCDADEQQTEKMIEQLLEKESAPPTFTDPALMYKQAKPDAVVIATPHTLHCEHGLQALDAGCHVLIEKPMATGVDQAEQLAAKASEAGRLLMIGYNSPYTPEFQYLRRCIREKALGQLELVVGHISQDWKGPTSGTWRQQPELSGGGQAYDSGAHVLNSLVWSVESEIAEVFAYVDNCGTPVDVNSSLNIRFASGVFASMVISGNCPVGGAHMAFIFDRGKVEVDPWVGKWINVFAGSQRVKYPPITGEGQTPDENFIAAILGHAEPLTEPVHGIFHSQLMEAIYESARTGRPAKPPGR